MEEVEKRDTKKRLNIRSDVVFKAVLGRDDPDSKLMLTDLLNAILDLKGRKQIVNITYKNPFNLQEFTSDKLTVMDIKIETGNGAVDSIFKE